MNLKIDPSVYYRLQYTGTADPRGEHENNIFKKIYMIQVYDLLYVCLKDFMCLNGSICKMLLGSHASK